MLGTWQVSWTKRVQMKPTNENVEHMSIIVDHFGAKCENVDQLSFV